MFETPTTLAKYTLGATIKTQLTSISTAFSLFTLSVRLSSVCKWRYAAPRTKINKTTQAKYTCGFNLKEMKKKNFFSYNCNLRHLDDKERETRARKGKAKGKPTRCEWAVLFICSRVMRLSWSIWRQRSGRPGVLFSLVTDELVAKFIGGEINIASRIAWTLGHRLVASGRCSLSSSSS